MKKFKQATCKSYTANVAYLNNIMRIIITIIEASYSFFADWIINCSNSEQSQGISVNSNEFLELNRF